MRRFMLAGAAIGLLALTAAGQDAVEIKLDKPKVGDKEKTTVVSKDETKMVITVNGTEMKKDEVKTKSLVYVDEVLAVTDGAPKPTKLKRTYEKAVISSEDKETTLSVEKKTVLIEKKGEKYTFTIDGKAVEEDAAKLLNEEFGKADKDDERDIFFPKKALKPGETWKIDSNAIAKAMGEKDLKIDKSKVEASGKLLKVYKQDGKQFGVLEVKISAPITDLGPKAQIKIKDGTLSITLSGDGVIDGTSPQGKSKTVTKFALNGGGDGFDLKIDATLTNHTTSEPVK